MTNITISRRLLCAAGFCRNGAYIADVGTDHAYLPIYLWKKGIIRGGVVSDVNKGPIERATAHIAENGASDALIPLLCDGLLGLEKYKPEDIFILGMGGELIRRIISDAPFTRSEGIRLILQPMTHSEELRAFLWDNGYTIIEDILVRDEKIYRIIVAEYSGRIEGYTQSDALFGKIPKERREPLLFELLDHTKKVMTERIEGKSRAGADTDFERKIIAEIDCLQKGE